MAMGTRRRRQRQERLWISHNELAKGPGHPFYQRVNELLEEEKFDAFAEKECAKFYAANNGRLHDGPINTVFCAWSARDICVPKAHGDLPQIANSHRIQIEKMRII